MPHLTTLLSNETGGSLAIELVNEGTRSVAPVYINGQLHHFERILKSEFTTNYRVDSDNNYNPVSDKAGYCYILVPASC